MSNRHGLIDWIGIAIINAGWIRVESTTFPQAAESGVAARSHGLCLSTDSRYDNPRQVEHQVRGRGDNMTLAMSSTLYIHSALHDFFRLQPELKDTVTFVGTSIVCVCIAHRLSPFPYECDCECENSFFYASANYQLVKCPHTISIDRYYDIEDHKH